MRSPEPPPSRADKAHSIAGIILGATTARTPGSMVWAALATVALHAAAGAFAWHAARTRAARAPVVATPKQTMRIDHVVDLQPPTLPEPPPPPRQPTREARTEPPPSRARSLDRAHAPAPAQAGAVVAIKEAEAPIDFTGFDITSGQARTTPEE